MKGGENTKKKHIIVTLLAVTLILIAPTIKVRAVSQAYDDTYGYFWWLSNSSTSYDYYSGGYHQSWGSSPKASPVRYSPWCEVLSWDNYYCYSRYWSEAYSAADYAALFPGAPPQRAGLESAWNYAGAPFYDGAGSANNPGPNYWQTPPWNDGSGIKNNYRKVVIERYRRPRPQFYTWGLYGDLYGSGGTTYWAKPGAPITFMIGEYDPEGKCHYIYGRLAGTGIDNRDFHDFNAAGTSHSVFQSDGGNYFTGVSETVCPADRSACAVNWYFNTPADGKDVTVGSYIYNLLGLPEYMAGNSGTNPPYHDFYTLKSDGTAPTYTGYSIISNTTTDVKIKITGVNDHGRSGVDPTYGVMMNTWMDGQTVANEQNITSQTVPTGSITASADGGDWVIDIPRSKFNSGILHAQLITRDNVQNVYYGPIIDIPTSNLPPQALVDSEAPWWNAPMTLDGSYSCCNTAGASITSYAWNITNAKGVVSNFTSDVVYYTPGAIGKVKVWLTVTDSNGLSDTGYWEYYAYNNNPLASFNVSPASVLSGSTITYSNTSTDIDKPSGDSLAYTWSYSDGGETGAIYGSEVIVGSNPQTSFTCPQNQSKNYYRIYLTAKDLAGATSKVSKDLIVYPSNTTPIANFTVTPSPQFITGTLAYVDSSTPGDTWDTIKNKTWAYSSNGGTTWSSENAAPPTNFPTSGTYQIRLTVTDTGNALSASKTDTDIKTVTIVQPLAAFTVSPDPQLSGTTLAYSDTSSTNISGNAISAREWSYSTDNGTTWSTATATAPTNFTVTTSTTYKIRLRIKSTASGAYPAIWSDYASDTVTILPINTSPTAAFTVTPSPQFITGTLTYVDSSTAGDSWDTIKSKTWAYSSNGGTTWSSENAAPPTNFPTSGTYQIRLTVTDTGNALSSSKTATAIQTVKIVQPTAAFTVSPNPQLTGLTILYSDNSTTNIGGNSISAEEWSYSADNGTTWSSTSNSPPFSFTTKGVYKIRLRVASTATGPYPKVWSNYAYQVITINNNLTLSATLAPNPAQQGQKITLNIVTTGYANYETITFPSQISSTPITLNVVEKPIDTEIVTYIIPLTTPVTLDEQGNRLLSPYNITIMARNADGLIKNVTLPLDVQGNVLDGIKTEIIQN